MSLYTQIGSLDSTITKPIGIFLHGFGANAQNICPVADSFTEIIQDWYLPEGIVDLSTYTGYAGRAWFPNTLADIHAALQGEYWKHLSLLDDPSILHAAEHVYAHITELGLLHRPIVLAGFSQGAMMCTELALLCLQHSIPISAIILFSGSLIAQQRWDDTMKAYETATLIQTMPIIQFHGNEDTVLSLANGEALYSFWKQYTNAIQFHIFDGMHTIPLSAILKAKQFLRDIL